QDLALGGIVDDALAGGDLGQPQVAPGVDGHAVGDHAAQALGGAAGQRRAVQGVVAGVGEVEVLVLAVDLEAVRVVATAQEAGELAGGGDLHDGAHARLAEIDV